MKKVILLCSVVFALASCNSGKGSAPIIPSIDDDVVLTDSTDTDTLVHADPTVIEERVKYIYEAVRRAFPEIHDISPSTDSLDMAFCSSQWQAIVAMVNTKDAESLGGTGFFESDYWIMGQDWDKISVSNVKANLKDDTHADVTFDLHNITTTKVKLQMVFERGEWMVDNFINLTNNFDWKKGMTKYMEGLEKKSQKEDNQIIEYEIP